MTVSEAQIEAGIEAAEKQFWESVSSHDVKAIYLAMKAAEPLPQGDEVERFEAVVKVARRCEVTMMGAAISKRDWHSLEVAYNKLRDRMDAELNRPVTAIGSQSIEGERPHD